MDDVREELQQRFQDNGDDITIDIVDDEYKFLLTNNNDDGIRIINPVYEPRVLSEDEFNVDIEFTANHKLGFTDDTRDEWISSNGGTYKAPSIAKVLNTSIYYITSKTIGDSLRTLTPQHEHMEFHMIGSVLNNVRFGDINQKDYDDNEVIWFDMDNGLNKFDIEILDEHYNPADLNDANCIFEFIFFKQ